MDFIVKWLWCCSCLLKADGYVACWIQRIQSNVWWSLHSATQTMKLNFFICLWLISIFCTHRTTIDTVCMEWVAFVGCSVGRCFTTDKLIFTCLSSANKSSKSFSQLQSLWQMWSYIMVWRLIMQIHSKQSLYILGPWCLFSSFWCRFNSLMM